MTKHAERNQDCPVCETPKPFDRDFEFEDETGFVCRHCDSNIFYEVA